MSVQRTIRVNRVVNTTSGKNNQTATTRTAAAPRRVMQKRAGQKPISITIHNIFKPVNNSAPQGGKSRGFKRTGRKATTTRSVRTNRIQRAMPSGVMTARPTMATRATSAPQGVRPVSRPTTRRANRSALRANRRSFKGSRRALKTNKRVIRANRKLTPRQATSSKRIVRTNPITNRGTSRFFGRKRR